MPNVLPTRNKRNLNAEAQRSPRNAKEDKERKKMRKRTNLGERTEKMSGCNGDRRGAFRWCRGSRVV
jgi:hypothetical protein